MQITFYIPKTQDKKHSYDDDAMFQMAESIVDKPLKWGVNGPVEGYIKYAEYNFVEERIRVIAELNEGSRLTPELVKGMF